MLEYTKTVLKQVSFDRVLFSKELKKALNYLIPAEIEELKDWLVQLTKTNPELQQCLQIL